MNTILTLDPSFTAFGWAIMSLGPFMRDGAPTVVSSGCIKTAPQSKKLRIRKSDDRSRRIAELAGELNRIIEKHQPALILSEAPHGSQTSAAATMIGAVTGIIQTLSVVREIPVEWYSENDAKKTLLGKASVTKEQTIEAVQKTYPTFTPKGVKYVDEAVADAIAVFNVAWMTQSPTLRILAK